MIDHAPATADDNYWDSLLGAEKNPAVSVSPKTSPDKRVSNTKLAGAQVGNVIKSYSTPPTGLFIGLTDVDKQFGRLLIPGSVTQCGARPSMGKTVFGVQVAEHHATNGINTLVWSLEMSLDQLIDRLIAKHSGVSVKRLMNREIDAEDWPKITAAGEAIHKLPLYVNDLSAASSQTIKLETTLLHQELLASTGKGLGLVVIDYIQLATSEEQSTRELEVASVSAALRCLAKDLNIPILVLAQLNRDLEKRGDKRPSNSDLRESGTIEQDAAVIIFLYRESVYCDDCRSPLIKCTKNHEHDAELIVGKNRTGTPGIVPIYFDGERQAFRNKSFIHGVSNVPKGGDINGKAAGPAGRKSF